MPEHNENRSGNGERKSVKAREVLNWVWAGIGIVATIGGAVTFFVLDVPELLGLRDTDQPPTPLPIASAAEGEILVIVTDFTGDESLEADTRIYRSLSERVAASQLENVRVERLTGTAPLLAQDATAIGETYGATLVIWGTADTVGIEPRYEVVRYSDLIREQTELGITTADIPAFEAYVAQGAPNEFEYLMLFSLGQIAYFSGDYETASARFSEALSVGIDGARGEALGYGVVYFYQGYAAHVTGSLQTALDSYSQALAINPGNYNAHFNRALIYYEMDRYAAAIIDYDEAIRLNPRDPRFFANRAAAYGHIGNTEAAIEDYTTAIELGHETAMPYNNRGLLYFQEGNLELAMADFDSGIAIEPENANLYNNRAYVAASLGGDLDQALADVTLSLSLDPANANAYDTRGWVYYRRGDYESALPDLDKALEYGEPYAYYTRGLTHEALGNIEAAKADYTQFLAAFAGTENAATQDARARLEALESSAP